METETARERASEAVAGWRRAGHLDAVVARLRTLALASAAYAVVYLFAPTPDGLTGFVLYAWFLATVPVAAVTGALYLTLRSLTDPAKLRETDDDVALLAIWSLALLATARERSPAGRAAWGILLRHPPDSVAAVGEEAAVVSRATRYVRYAGYGSVAVVALDQLWQQRRRLANLVVDPGTPAWTAPSPGESVLLVVGAVVVGAGIGLLLAAARA